MDGVNQGHLVKALEVLFPAHRSILNARKVTNLTCANGSHIELDIWFPDIKLGFEFQDDYHYVTTWYVQRSKDKIKSVDYEKRFILHQNGICLITVPCWWDGSPESLASTIHFHKPDHFFRSMGVPIPLVPVDGFFSTPEIPGVGELMIASFPMDTKDKTLHVAAETWWMGEKYDGIRCCWNPDHHTAYTRIGKELELPPSVAKCFPAIFVDGELWFGRGQYASVHVLFKDYIENVHWHLLRMAAFDNADINIQNCPFEERYRTLLDTISKNHSFTLIAMRMLCNNNAHVSEMIDGILSNGGEGVILRKVNSLYEHGRTPSLVKLKTSLGDKEAIVVAILDNNSVRLKLPSGEVFEVPEAAVLVSHIKQGDVVSFTYESNSRRDLPINPKIFRVRTDLSWEDVIYNSAREKAFLNDTSRVSDYKSQPMGHWTKKTMRAFMEKFAKHWKMDPLVAETWYRLQDKIRKYKGGRAIVYKCKGYVNAVRILFPDVKLDDTAFQISSWRDVRNRRKFFEDYAWKRGFDPHKPENWYKQNKNRIKQAKGAYGVISYHKFNVTKALLDLFPNIGLERSGFQLPSGWNSAKNRREFFVNYARSVGFSPLDANAWYSHYSDITVVKGVYSVISYHGYSISKALIALFPEVSFNRNKFQTTPWEKKNPSLWNKENERRKFFEAYALKRNFDPLIAANWYSESREKIVSIPGAFRILHHHNRSISQALCDLFPDIGIDETKFHYRVPWNKWERRRKFLEDYAKENGFDPLLPSNWYSHPAETLIAAKGISSIVYYHNKSIITAMLELFPNIGFDRAALKAWRFKHSRTVPTQGPEI